MAPTAHFYEDVCGWYRIREGTKNECVAVGSKGNIVRWPETGGAEQLWLLIPVAKRDRKDGNGVDKVKFMTQQNGEYMAVGANGKIVRWGDTGGDEQEFHLANPSADGWNIYESTKGELLSVGSSGKLLRWGATGGKEQRFKFEPFPTRKKPSLQPGGWRPGQIPDVPRMAAFSPQPPETSEVYLIAESLLPATVVTDQKYRDRRQQVASTPYYIVRREQFWDRKAPHGFVRDHPKDIDEKLSRELRYQVTDTEGSSSQETLGLEFGVEGGYSRKKSPFSAKLSAKFSSEMVISDYDEKEVVGEAKELQEIFLPKGSRFMIACWSLVNRYTVLRCDGQADPVVASWNVPEHGRIVVDGYPRAEFEALASMIP